MPLQGTYQDKFISWHLDTGRRRHSAAVCLDL